MFPTAPAIKDEVTTLPLEKLGCHSLQDYATIKGSVTTPMRLGAFARSASRHLRRRRGRRALRRLYHRTRINRRYKDE